MKLIIASNNTHKSAELKSILSTHFDEIITLKEAGIQIDIPENGQTFAENAATKAQTIAKIADCAALGDDSGLMVDALNGDPGIYSARYAGEDATDATNNALLLQRLEDVSVPRTANFICAIALARPGKPLLLATGMCAGQILRVPQGENGFGYDPYFVPEGYTQTFAQLDAGIKNAISHRANALKELLQRIEEE